MSDEPKPHTSRFGAILVLLAVGGSAIGAVSWHLLSNRGNLLDTSGFDMSAPPGRARLAAPASLPASLPASSPPAPATTPQTSLGMVKADAGMRAANGGSASSPYRSAAATPKEAAALNLREAAIRHEKSVAAFIRRMQAKHPSIARYGKDWAASPELRALRDRYWKEKDPLKFAYGLAKSNDFRQLVKKYAMDPGIRDVLITGIREAPASLLGAAGGVLQNDKVARSLVTTVLTAAGLPASLAGFLDGADAKPPDPNQAMADIINSALKDRKDPGR